MQFGAERVCLAFDVRADATGTPLVQTRGWTRATSLSLWDAVAGFASVGLLHVLCTDVDRDGAMGGPAVGLYADAVRRFPAIRWQASGGVRDASDLVALRATGVAAAISGKALLEERIAADDLKAFLAG